MGLWNSCVVGATINTDFVCYKRCLCTKLTANVISFAHSIKPICEPFSDNYFSLETKLCL